MSSRQLSFEQFNQQMKLDNYHDLIKLDDINDIVSMLIDKITWTDIFDNEGKEFDRMILEFNLTRVRLSNINLNSILPDTLLKLHLRNTSIEIFDKVSKLKTLICENCIFKNRDDILESYSIKSLKLSNTDIHWCHLNKLSSLENLAIENSDVTSDQLMSLEQLKNLKSLDLKNCPNLKFDFIIRIQNLTELSIQQCPLIDDKDLRNIDQLTKLRVNLNYNIDTLNLNHMKKLKYLSLKSTNSRIDELFELETLFITESLSPCLKNLSKLKKLCFDNSCNELWTLNKLPENIEELTVISSTRSFDDIFKVIEKKTFTNLIIITDYRTYGSGLSIPLTDEDSESYWNI